MYKVHVCTCTVSYNFGLGNGFKNHFFRSKQYVYIYFRNSYTFKNFMKDAPNMVLSNEPFGTQNIVQLHTSARKKHVIFGPKGLKLSLKITIMS